MTTVFIGGSRHVTRLPAEFKKRLDTIVDSGHQVIVGDANGADKAVQKHLQAAAYDKVLVFCSGDSSRNNIGDWPTCQVRPAGNAKGFQFYAAKDRAMAHEANVGLMIWDGKSPGTVLNVLRLIGVGKPAVLFSVVERKSRNIKTSADWQDFLAGCSDELRHELHQRATLDEVELLQENLIVDPEKTEDHLAILKKQITAINDALAAANMAAVIDTLGTLAKSHGMAHVAKETGLARESLYRALASNGNPEFSTVLKVMSSLGLRLAASEIQAQPKRHKVKAKVEQPLPDLLALLDHAT